LLISWIVERIAYKASLDRTITVKGGVQNKLDALAALPAFQIIMNKEVAIKQLVAKDVERCVKCLYHEVSKHAHGNTGDITIREADYNPNEYVALITFLKLQDLWSHPLTWKEEKLEAKIVAK
jgi:hypothetical protein